MVSFTVDIGFVELRDCFTWLECCSDAWMTHLGQFKDRLSISLDKSRLADLTSWC